MPIQLIFGKSQTGCIIFNPTQPIHLWTRGYCPSLTESEPVSLDRTVQINGGHSLWLCRFSFCSFLDEEANSSSYTVVLSTFVSSGLLAHLLPLCSTPSDLSVDECGVHEELHYLSCSNFCGLSNTTW